MARSRWLASNHVVSNGKFVRAWSGPIGGKDQVSEVRNGWKKTQLDESELE